MAIAMPRNAARKADDKPHLSASQLRTYCTCSLKWAFSRRYAPEFVGSGLVFGSAFHSALQAFYQGCLEGRDVGPVEMIAAYDQAWQEDAAHVIRYGKNESAESLRETACRMIEAFLAQVAPGKIVAIEEPFSCLLADDLPPLVGYIDLIEIKTDPDGVERLHMVDFKTAARRPSADEGPDQDQLTLYSIAAFRTGILSQFGLPLMVRVDTVTKTKAPEVVSQPFELKKSGIKRLIEKARVCGRGMKAGLCFPQSGWMCSNCGHNRRCAAWPGDLGGDAA
jgi:putative RecB family exonuclease